MDKLDLKKALKALYAPSAKEPVLADVPSMQFLMIDGEGDPNESQAFQDAFPALYGMAYTLKFAARKAGLQDYVVMPPEALWWSDEAGGLDLADKSQWQWTLMIAQPDFIPEAMVAAAREQLEAKKDPAGLERLRFARYDEGRSAQVMHLGPYAEEGPTIERLHAFIRGQGFELRGKHHEIYLGDPRRTKPERLKTVVRQPVGEPGKDADP